MILNFYLSFLTCSIMPGSGELEMESMHVSGVGSPSVYVLLLLVSDQICFGQWLSRIGQGRSSKQIEEERVGGVRDKPCSH